MVRMVPNGHESAPATLVSGIERSLRGMDQKLGYPGRERFVLFYYESRGEEVIWKDGKSYGFATGAWEQFMDHVAPMADLHGVNVGADAEPATHVLLVDRTEHRAYFMDRAEAERFIESGEAELPRMKQESTVEITQESIAQLAYDIWQERGRPEGQTLADWLEAEARLRAMRHVTGDAKLA